jgi:2-hydroxy-6-oxonona-2,4-dienedioate hydrolase
VKGVVSSRCRAPPGGANLKTIDDCRMTVSQQTITIEGRPAKYWSGGSGKPLVLLHGELGDAHQHWRTCLEALAAQFSIIAPDLPGFGVSAPLPMPSYQNYLNWLQLLFDMLNLGGPLVMMGHSFGAVLCRLFAAENTSYVSRLALIDGGAIVDTPGSQRLLYRLPILSNVLLSAMRRRTYSIAGLQRALGDPQLITPEFNASAEAAARGYLAVWQQVASSAPPALRTPTCPTLVIWGEHDEVSPIENGRQLVAQINGAKFKSIPHAAHLPQLEQPDEFQRIALPFLLGR